MLAKPRPAYRILQERMLAKPHHGLMVKNPDRDGNLELSVRKYGATIASARVKDGDLNDAAVAVLAKITDSYTPSSNLFKKFDDNF